MPRPTTIRLFELFYLGSLAASLGGFALGFDTAIAQLNTDPNLSASPQVGQIATGAMIGAAVIMVVITLILWFFTAYKRSMATRIIIVVLFVLGLALTLVPLVLSPAAWTMTVPMMLNLATYVLDAAAVMMLFLPASNAWFAGRGVNVAETFR